MSSEDRIKSEMEKPFLMNIHSCAAVLGNDSSEDLQRVNSECTTCKYYLLLFIKVSWRWHSLSRLRNENVDENTSHHYHYSNIALAMCLTAF